MDNVFAALANASRRRILDLLREHPGCSLQDLCDYFEISRIAVMKHLRVLEKALLVVSRKEGRQRQLYFNAVPIQMIYDRWTSEYSAYWASGLTRIKYRLEGAKNSPQNQPGEGPARKERKRHA